jgi:hypothetical protein
MIIRSLAVLVLAVGIIPVSTGAESNRDWQMGKVRDFWKNDVYEDVLIGGQTHSYVARRLLNWRVKPARLTVNGPVKFAVKKNTLFLIDEDGKERAFEINKKTLLERPDQSKVPQ